MSLTKLGIAGTFFDTEVTIAAAVSTTTGASSNSNGIGTVTTTAAHGLVAGNFVTFSGAGNAAYNGTIFVVLSAPTTTTFTIGVGSLGTISTATTVQPVFLPGQIPWASGSANATPNQVTGGDFYITVAANAIVEYNPDNTGLPQNVTNVNVAPVSGATWRTAIATSSQGEFDTDGYAIRIRIVSTTANTFLSRVK